LRSWRLAPGDAKIRRSGSKSGSGRWSHWDEIGWVHYPEIGRSHSDEIRWAQFEEILQSVRPGSNICGAQRFARREYLDRVFFWNVVDLARKLEAFRDYYNGHRVHRARAGALSPAPTALDHYGWRRHCQGLFELPIAA